MSDLQRKTGDTTRQRYFRLLQEGTPVEFCIEACQPVHSRYADCRQCEQACPVGALHMVGDGLALDASCVGCGQCAVACPTGALGVAGFALPPIAPEQTDPVYLDCWKVPATHSPKNAVRVPCLGGLALSRLIELRVAAGARPIVLLDRGWCASCAAGVGNAHPATSCVDTACELLQAIRIPQGQWPVIESRPLPAARASSSRADRSSEQRLSRRAFFSDLAARTANTVSEINPLTSGKQPPIARGYERQPARSRDRDRFLAQIKLLAQSTGSALPASLFPAVQVDEHRCRHHQLCAATCPTGALTAFDTSGVTGLVFDSSGCIACGHCEAVCPEQALQLLPHGDGQVPSGAKVLARIRQRACGSCGRPFEATSGEERCPNCSKRAQLAQSAFQTLFGRPN